MIACSEQEVRSVACDLDDQLPEQRVGPREPTARELPATTQAHKYTAHKITNYDQTQYSNENTR